MQHKFVAVLLSFYLLTVLNQNNRVEAFNFFDLIRTPLGKMAESLFGWNPFKNTNPLRNSLYGKMAFDDADLIRAASNISNDTITKGRYSYGCNCIEYSCRCCSHVEINQFNLNNSGLIKNLFKK